MRATGSVSSPVTPDVLDDVDRGTPTYRAFESMMRLLARYHDYRVYGVERVPLRGGAVIAFNHSLATYDGLFLGIPLLDERGRAIRGLGDRQLFKTPGVARVAREVGFVPASLANTEELLRRGQLLGIAPGGMREALRPSTHRYEIRWDDRRGFVRMAMKTGVPIVLAASPRGDEIFTVYDNPLTRIAYRTLRLPVPVARGLGPTLLPRPVKIRQLVSEPIFSDVAPDQVRDSDVDALHSRIVRRMVSLLKEAQELT